MKSRAMAHHRVTFHTWPPYGVDKETICTLQRNHVDKNKYPSYTYYMENLCIGPECKNTQRARKMCVTHYGQWRRGKELTPIYITGVPRQRAEDAVKRDKEGNKLCVKCLEWKPEEEYFKNPSTGDGLFAQCKGCLHDRRSLRKYGVVKKDLVDKQNGLCAICKSEDIQGKRGHIDHDHNCCPGVNTCGRCVRGVLCVRCNHGLGHFYDQPDVLRAAAAYVERFRESC